jgi:dipeptidyl aminopeptidase/acylaminoacyl peptidase
MLLVGMEGYPPIEQVARPFLRLAGLRVDPKLGARQRLMRMTGIEVVPLDGKPKFKVVLPEGSRISAPSWSPDGARFAFTRDLDDGVELWVAEAATGKARAIEGLRIVDLLGQGFAWVDGSKLLVHQVPPGRGPAPPEPKAPSGPNIEETSGRVAQTATYQDLLKSPRDEELFRHFATSQLARVDAISGAVEPVGEPALISMADPSPDGKFLLVTTLKGPFSYRVPYPMFARTISVLDATGKLVRTIADLPIADDTPRQAGEADLGRGPRRWRPDPQGPAPRPAADSRRAIPGGAGRADEDPAPVRRSRLDREAERRAPDRVGPRPPLADDVAGRPGQARRTAGDL